MAAIALSLLAGMSGCGFQPLYGEPGDAPTPYQALHHISIGPISDRAGVRLRAELERLFSPLKEPARHRLDVKLGSQVQVMAIEEDASIRRTNLQLIAHVRLLPSAVPEGQDTVEPEFVTTVRANAGTEQLPSDFSTLVSERATEQRAVELLAQRIRQELALHFAGKA